MASSSPLKLVPPYAVLLAALVIGLFVTLLPDRAWEQPLGGCNPAGAPSGSIGCQPNLQSAQASDMMLLWRPSIYPNSQGQVTLDKLQALMLSMPTKLPTACTGLPTGTLWNNANVVSVCP